MRVIITGSRKWTDREAIAEVLRELRDTGATLVSGACPTGADRIAEEIWDSWDLPIERHPADWYTYGKAAGPIRNQLMVNAGADLCIAFPLDWSRGTLDCIHRANAAGIPVRVTNQVTPISQ